LEASHTPALLLLLLLHHHCLLPVALLFPPRDLPLLLQMCHRPEHVRRNGVHAPSANWPQARL
jgi:hypothetical protein